jgi:N4-gp56 family major capsid protein
MAQSTWASGLQVSRWAKQLWYEAGKEIYFKKFMGEGSNFMIHEKNELDNADGKDVTVGLLMNPSGTGVTGDDTLEGNEEKLVTYSQTVTLQRVRNAFRNTGKFDDKKVLYSFRKEALGSLSLWLAEKVDSDIFTALTASPTRTFRADNGGDSVNSRLNESSTSAQLVAADLITPADISVLKKAAKTPKGSNEVKIRPIRVGGEEYYILLIHPEQAYDLSRNSEWRQNMREAAPRGSDNPIFKGMLGRIDNVVIHEHELITTSNSYGGGSVHGAQALFLGAQAGIFANSGEPEWVEKTFDYGNQLGVAGGLMYKAAKSKFNSEDFACISYYTACTRMS